MTTKFDISRLKTLALMGSCEAMYELGRKYYAGVGVEADLQKSYEYFLQAHNKGFRPATDVISHTFQSFGGTACLLPKAREEYGTCCTLLRAADHGDPYSLYCISVSKLDDDSDDFFFKRGVKEMSLACKQGYAPALYSLGLVYLRANRITNKMKKGMEMLLQAAEKEYIPAVTVAMRFAADKVLPILKRMTQAPEADPEALYLLGQYLTEDGPGKPDYAQGLSLLKKASEMGSLKATLSLGNIYEFGQCGVTPDINKAVEYYEQGTAKGDAACMLNLAVVLESSDTYPHDEKRAFELYSKVAQQGHAEAYNNLGTCYKRGIGTKKDARRALKLYLKANEMGCEESYMNLYRYYMDEVCVPRNFEKAVEWAKKGDVAGVLACTYILSLHYKNGDGVERDEKKQYECLLKASKGGYRDAYDDLGDCYRYGIGTEQDGNKAFELYQKAAEFSASALCNLAQCYTYAIGTAKDDRKAVELYTMAAEQGDAQAQYDLGICYRQGEGVEADPKTAIKWYLKAAEQGHGDAWANLGVMYENGIGVEKDYAKALSCFKTSAEAGNLDGMFCYGKMYYTGHGVEQNYKEAVEWFSTAALQGEPDSMYHLAICYDKGLGVEIDSQMRDRLLYEAADRGFQPAIDTINELRIPRPVANEE